MEKCSARSGTLIMLALLVQFACLSERVNARAQSTANLAQGKGEAAAATILSREQAGSIMPATVFFRGQSAPIQARNSAGLRLAGDRLVLAAMVDTSGYSTAVAQRYQAYLITEVALKLGEKTLAPGAYGFGFVEGDRMVLMDVGGNEILSTSTVRDAALTRPTPLQIRVDSSTSGRFRLYLGRSYVVVAAELQ